MAAAWKCLVGDPECGPGAVPDDRRHMDCGPGDPYEDAITNPACLAMRAASGRINDDRMLVAFFYHLGRDLLPLGSIEQALRDAERGQPTTEDPDRYTNGWLAQWAQHAADRLVGQG